VDKYRAFHPSLIKSLHKASLKLREEEDITWNSRWGSELCPSHLIREQKLEDRNMIIGAFGSLEIKSRCIEGWASFMPESLSEIPKPPF